MFSPLAAFDQLKQNPLDVNAYLKAIVDLDNRVKAAEAEIAALRKEMDSDRERVRSMAHRAASAQI